MREYLKRIFNSRYFWLHLARAELKYKFRRSKLGILWTFLNPLLLTLLMSIVFGTVFKISINEYAPYILSGLIVWEMIVSSVVAASSSIIVSEPYIRQFNHPVSIYPLKAALVYIISFLIASFALSLWVLFLNPKNLFIGFISLPFTIILYFLIIWPICIISSLIGTKYRDYPQVMALVMQALWYVSPVFFKSDMFERNKYVYEFFKINPITHILNLLRFPFLYGKVPSICSYIIVIVIIMILFFIAIIFIKKYEKHIIFYL